MFVCICVCVCVCVCMCVAEEGIGRYTVVPWDAVFTPPLSIRFALELMGFHWNFVTL